MNELDLWRLGHMLETAKEAIAFVQKESKQILQLDRKLVLALAMEITIIGEAASRISKELQGKHPEIPWSNIVGMRNIVVHAYFKIDLDTLWETVTEWLPELIPQLEAVIASENNSSLNDG